MQNTDLQVLQVIDHLHSECSKMNKVARLAYLRGRWNRLNQIAWQFGAYLQGRVGITQAERQCAQRLIDMIKEVEAEGVKLESDLQNDVLKELANVLMKM